MIKDTIQTPNSGNIAAIFTAESGLNSFADADATYDGICEVCHTLTTYHLNDGSGASHNDATNCTGCHPHSDNFAPSAACNTCHDYPPSGSVSPDLDGSHSSHYGLTTYGPKIDSCGICHVFSGPTHQNGEINFADNQLLAATTVCDNCHSSGGLFDGVNDTDHGAKNNWADGVYNSGVLKTGKENWCSGCHDADRASTIFDGSGVLAPDVAGDSASYGFYYSGHGKSMLVKCANCHDPSLNHIDSIARTYTYSQAIANLDGSVYRTAYRLNTINGLEPMRIPLNDQAVTQLDSANFRLCMNCHIWDYYIDVTSPYTTNFNHSGANASYSYGFAVSAEMNSHEANHVGMDSHYGIEPYWDSDWNDTTTSDQVGNNPEINGYDSFITCVTCHDVHGGQAFGSNTEGNMMRDGRLSGRYPGLNYTYIIEAGGGFPLVTSVGANKANSVGGVVRSGVDYRAGYGDAVPQADAICGGCHGEQYPSTDEFNATGNAGNFCTECHMMSVSDDYFLDYFRTPITTGCTFCHAATLGSRRAVAGASGDFIRTSHHADGVTDADCKLCHYTGNHTEGTVQLLDPDMGEGLVYDYDAGNLAVVENFCLNCHDTDGLNGDLTPFSDNVTVPTIDNTLWTASSHKISPYTCMDCHDNGHGSNKNKLLQPYDKIADASADPMDDEEEFCESCHSTAGAALTDIESEFNLAHAHQVDETLENGVNSGLECISCHNPHKNSSAYPLSSPDDNSLQWTGNEKNFCITCHDGVPPAGITFPTTTSQQGVFAGQDFGSGWDKSDYVGSRHDSQFPDTGNDCQKCHENHGSGNYSLLLGTYLNSDRESGTYNASDFNTCFQGGCHTSPPSDAVYGFHDYHAISDFQVTCIHCHDVHASREHKITGTPESGLIDFQWGFDWCTVTTYDFMGGTDLQTSFTPGSCYINCHYMDHNPETY